MPQQLSEETKAAQHKNKFKTETENTKVFDDWSQTIQKFFLTSVKLEEGELPIMAHFQPKTTLTSALKKLLLKNIVASNWFLLTTRRILWMNPDQNIRELRHENIESVAWSSGPVGWPGRDMSDPPDTLVFIEGGKGHCQSYSPWLQLVDFSGTRYEVFLEPGKTLIAIRNIIWRLSAGWEKALERAVQANQSSAENQLPPTGSDAYKAMRCERILVQYYPEYKHLSLFRSFSTDVQNFLLEQAQLESEEIPVFAFFNNQETWLLATTRKIIWSRPGYKHHLPYNQIEEMGWSIGPAGEPRKDPAAHDEWIETENGKQSTKIASPWLFILDKSNIRHEALLENATIQNAVWNTIRFMKNLDAIHPAPSTPLDKDI